MEGKSEGREKPQWAQAENRKGRGWKVKIVAKCLGQRHRLIYTAAEEVGLIAREAGPQQRELSTLTDRACCFWPEIPSRNAWVPAGSAPGCFVTDRNDATDTSDRVHGDSKLIGSGDMWEGRALGGGAGHRQLERRGLG